MPKNIFGISPRYTLGDQEASVPLTRLATPNTHHLSEMVIWQQAAAKLFWGTLCLKRIAFGIERRHGHYCNSSLLHSPGNVQHILCKSASCEERQIGMQPTTLLVGCDN
jgi:hypothetical protein